MLTVRDESHKENRIIDFLAPTQIKLRSKNYQMCSTLHYNYHSEDTKLPLCAVSLCFFLIAVCIQRERSQNGQFCPFQVFSRSTTYQS